MNDFLQALTEDTAAVLVQRTFAPEGMMVVAVHTELFGARENHSVRIFCFEILLIPKNALYLHTLSEQNDRKAENGEVGEWLKPPVC